MTKKLLAILLSAVMCMGVLAGCQSNSDTPLVVGMANFSAKFSPFFAESAYDKDVVDLTQVSLMTTDRTGAIVYNAIEGETISYNGTDYTYKGISDITVTQNNDTTVYNIKLKQGVKFSDGQELTADDVIFSYYVLLDPSYTGSSTLNSTPIIGVLNYQMNSTAAENVTITAAQIAAELANPSDAVLASIKEYIANILTGEYTWCGENYATYGAASQDEFYISAYALDAEAVSGMSGDELIKAVIAQYDADYKTLAMGYAGDETYFDADMSGIANDYLLEQAVASAGGAEVPSVEGIKKLGDYEVEVTTNGFDAAAIYQICGISVSPLHYYGDESAYDYDNNKFGFTRGDLSGVEAKTSTPMGAGPYKFIKYENKVVYFEANENYYKGTPKTKNVQFKETTDADKIPGVNTGDIDVTDPDGSVDAFNAIKSYNGNKELSGDTIITNTVDNLGYGYIGINADTVNVGGNPSSEASKNLRKGLATIFSIHRETAISSYYGDVASVINYPISNTSWAAPQKSDADYKEAYSVDVNGNAIYTSSMDDAAKVEAAKAAAVDFFKAAGYTYDEAAGRFTAAPSGASMNYEILIPGDGTGDHPSFAILSSAKADLEEMGITLTITDLTNSADLWDKIDANQHQLWTAAWQATIDPDMYQVYHSSNVVTKGGSNNYNIADSELDKLIVDARTSADQAYRKATYKSCLDVILDWGVEIPVYQRQNAVIYSAKRINTDTFTKDVTTFYGWMSEIENIEMK